ncbi:hypothetical protein [Pseudomonas sp. FEN]|uniref:hypothetical protein n=1 Tax=Pseudomonas sp. FEN TaxID=2767468 RepID=UPI00174C4C02|nr:hypothetical protein [Pseudomonas sp. FEN]
MSSLPRHRIRQFDIVHYGRLQDSPAFEVFRQLELEAFYAFARRKTDVRRAEQALFNLARGKFRFFTLADEVLTQNAQDPEGRFRAYAFRLGDLELPPLFLDDIAAAVLEPGGGGAHAPVHSARRSGVRAGEYIDEQQPLAGVHEAPPSQRA